MAVSKAFASFLLFSFFLCLYITQARVQSESDDMVSNSLTKGHLLKKINCGAACSARCRLSSRPNLCHRACGTCCARCNCVPPGTSGNQEVCPCYANMTTHGGRRKCP